MRKQNVHGIYLLSVLPIALLLIGCSDNAQVATNPETPGQDAGQDSSQGPDTGVRDAADEETSVIQTPDAETVDTGPDAPPPACGDGKIDQGEKCDDGNETAGDGCTADCKAIEEGFACPTPGAACVTTVVCGDKKVSGKETCDDGNKTAGDGCSDACAIEAGWKCPVVGVACEPAKCGDGLVVGTEQCDDGNGVAGDGCSDHCVIEPGYKCEQPGKPCSKTTCGDGKREGSEPCDDGNNDMGDGCTPECKLEPNCKTGACVSRCGDGMILPSDTSEACDDGNQQPGDGCDDKCQVEPGFTCTNKVTVDGDELHLPIVLRDFHTAHPDMEWQGGVDKGIVKASLGADGKPVYAHGGTATNTVHSQTTFNQWYRDVGGVNSTQVQTLTLTKQTSGAYQFSSSSFFPLDGKLFGNEGNNHNFHFTSEVRYWFTYKGGESLAFTGDDDVWVFVNKHLAVDLGGVHGAMSGSTTLNGATAAGFGLETGKVYEIVVFQAERHTTQSNYRLTLAGFNSVHSECTWVCGDGIVTRFEVCDDGVNDGSYGGCMPGCQKRGPFCGDGQVQKDKGEACDDGLNISNYGGCAPGCKPAASCGDGQVDSLFGEQCDDGTNDGGYGECAAGCVLGPRCGDGVTQKDEGERCDDGNQVPGDGCGPDCQPEGVR